MRAVGFCFAWLLLVNQVLKVSAVENLLGKRAPDFALTDLDGKTVRLSQFQGKVVVLVFWAFWCDTWKETSDTLKALQGKFSPTYMQILCIAVDPSWKEIGQRMLSRTKRSFPILLDRGRRVSKLYGVNKVPTIFLLDKNGVIRFGFIGCPKPKFLEAAILQSQLPCDILGKVGND